MRVRHADVELWLTGWIREHLPGHLDGLTLGWVSNSERPAGLGGPPGAGEVHVIVRDDSGTRHDLILKEPSVGVTVLGDSIRALAPVKAVAETLVALIEGDAPLDAASPVADVPAVFGPHTVPGVEEARVYASLTLSLIGTSF